MGAPKKEEAKADELLRENQLLKTMINENCILLDQVMEESKQLKNTINFLKSNERPQYDASKKQKKTFFLFAILLSMIFVFLMKILRCNNTILYTLQLILLFSLAEISAYIQYFWFCKNRRQSWDKTNGFLLFLNVTTIILCLVIGRGELAFQYRMEILAGLILSKRYQHL